MIELHVKEYCKNCIEFEPETQTYTNETYDFKRGPEVIVSANTSVSNERIRGVGVMVKVRDILPLIQWNDAQIIKDQDEEICLLRNDFMVGSLSEEILNMTVTGIENDENIENTVVVYVTDKED